MKEGVFFLLSLQRQFLHSLQCREREDNMSQKDTLTKSYMSKPPYFADAFNASIFNGRQIVKADNLSLQELDSTEMGIIFTEESKDIVQKTRDILKKSVLMQDGKMTFLLLGIENQSEVHYAMPVRNLIYDALNYGKQVSKKAAEHKDKKDLHGSAEFLSGFSKTDKIMPVITLTVYFGNDEWDAPRCLKDMFPEDLDEEILEKVDNYALHLIVPTEIEDFSKFKTDFGKAMRFIAVSQKPEEVEKLSKDNSFKEVNADTVHLINECTGSNIEVPNEEKKVNMCKGMVGFGKKKAAEGENKLGRLITYLLSHGMTEEIEKAASDETARKEMYEKYGISD